MKKNIFWISGIVNFLLTTPVLVLETLRALDYLNEFTFAIYVIILLLYTITYVVFIYGFVLLGRENNLRLLTNMSYVLIASGILSPILFIGIPIYFEINELLLSIITVVSSGVISIPFGFGLLKLKDKFGDIAQVSGVLNIVAGFLLCSVILSIFGALLLLPTAIIEIIILYKASRTN